jgi:hypothetical protein
VREIFRMFVDEQKMPKAIAEELNARGLKYHGAVRDKMVRASDYPHLAASEVHRLLPVWPALTEVAHTQHFDPTQTLDREN